MTSADAKKTLSQLIDGQEVGQVFGAARACFIESLVATLKAIKPTEGELIEHGFNGWNKRKIAAYRKGVQHLKQAYNTTSPDLPAL